MMSYWSYWLHKKCPYLEVFWYVFSRIRTEYGDLLYKSPYSVRMRESTDQETPNAETFHAVTDSYTIPEKNWNSVRNNRSLPFSPVSHFYIAWKRQKTKGFLTFLWGIEVWHWTKMSWKWIPSKHSYMLWAYTCMLGYQIFQWIVKS